MSGIPGAMDLQQVLGTQDSVHDLRSLDRLRAMGRDDPDAGLRAAAKQFEAVFTQMLMKSMREANEVFDDDDLFSSKDGEFYQQMHDEQLAVTLSNRQSLGLADLMVAQLKGKPLPGTHQVAPLSSVSAATSITTSPATPAHAVQAKSLSAKVASPHAGAASTGDAYCPVMSKTANDPATRFADAFQTAPVLFSAVSSATPIATEVRARADLAVDPQLSFVSRVLPHAEKAARQLGTSAPVLIAQAALESGWGRSALADPQQQGVNNLFGIKADAEWAGAKVGKRTLEYDDGKPGWQQAWFRAYESVGAAFDDYVQFVKSSPRYEPAVQAGQDAKGYLQGLTKGGYATDPKYVQKVVGILESDRFGELIKQARELLGDVQAWSSHRP